MSALLRSGDPIRLTEKGARLMREPADRKGVVLVNQRRSAVQIIVMLEGQSARALPLGWVEKETKERKRGYR